nr:peptidylprolyl isomerase [Candidatus Gracilibacteria bacterium]
MKKIITIFIISVLSLNLLTSCGNKDDNITETKTGTLTTNQEQTMKKEMISTGDTVSLNYIGTLEDGTEFDNSYKRGEPLTFQAGAGQMIPGFDAGVMGMKVGEKKTMILEPKDAYGEYDATKVQKVNRADLKSFETAGYKLEKGEKLPTQYGMLKIIDANDKEITLDLNHELAGKTLKFEIEIVDIK